MALQHALNIEISSARVCSNSTPIQHLREVKTGAAAAGSFLLILLFANVTHIPASVNDAVYISQHVTHFQFRHVVATDVCGGSH